MLLGFPPGISVEDIAQRAEEQGKQRVKDTNIFANDICRRQGIERDRAGISRFILHEILQEENGTVIQRSMIGVIANTFLIKSQDNIDRRLWGVI